MSITQAEKGRLQKKLARYVWLLKEKMWLDRWLINILVTEYPGQSDTNLASISPTNAQYRADLEVATRAVETGGERLRHTIVHELLHLWYRDASDIFRLALPMELANSAYTLLWESYRQTFELMIDEMAGAWAEHLPLPDWGETP
jgi:hypothetical protein